MFRIKPLASIVTLALTALSLPLSAQAADSAVRWHNDIDKALAIAAESNRLVLVHFWKPSCGPCVKLDAQVFSEPRFAAVLEADYVPVKINTDQLPMTARRYGIEFLPTDIILTPDGKVAAKTSCPADGVDYARRLRETASSVRRNNGAQYAQADRSAAGQDATRNAPTSYASRDYAQREEYGRAPVAATEAPANAGNGYGTERRYANDMTSQPPVDATPRYGDSTPPQGAAPRMTSRDVPANNTSAANYTDQSGAAALPYGQPSGQSRSQSDDKYGGQTTNSSYQTYAPDARTPPPQDVARDRAPIAQSAAPSGPPALCLEGRCPVTFYDTRSWTHGDRRYGAVHRGRLYLFINAAAQQRFLADPDKYSPAVSGHDAVAWVEQGQLVPGAMKFGGQYRNLIYLFSSEATLRQFEANPERYAAPVEQAIAAGRNQGQIRR
jgi:YHS domain-containing protein/thiol-disulfide isomerase/thioredoxin